MRHDNAPLQPSQANDDYQLAIEAVAESRADWVWNSPAERASTADLPSTPMVDCPRCGGLGIRQVETFLGTAIETCSSCSASGLVDDETARAIERLMDLAHEAADPDRWVPAERTLDEQVAVEVRHFRSLGTPFGNLISETLERLGCLVRALDATTVEDFLDRRETLLSEAYRAAGVNR